jgi:LmbE family N-acetylglucosaminyl deacetylase
VRTFSLSRRPQRPLQILCIGAHSDDIEIGCGGTILRMLDEYPGSSVRWVVFSADDDREREARASAEAFLSAAASFDVSVFRYRESYFPHVWADIKGTFGELRGGPDPDLVLTHRRDDAHQDHRTLGELTWNTFRNHVVLEYEIPKYEGDLGQPNFYVALDPRVAERKVELLMTHFGSQRSRGWFRPETFHGLMALRAVECAAPGGSAEAFHARKVMM